jgi:D-3-phosphoglycerate dehydrogenase
MTNVVLTPHIGGATEETEETMTSLVAAGIASILEGRAPVNVINPEALATAAGREAP